MSKTRSSLKLQQGKQVQCVQCQSRAVRILSNGQYFCADCCMQFVISEEYVTLYAIGIDGGLLKIS